jgi:hypothetical protein
MQMAPVTVMVASLAAIERFENSLSSFDMDIRPVSAALRGARHKQIAIPARR